MQTMNSVQLEAHKITHVSSFQDGCQTGELSDSSDGSDDGPRTMQMVSFMVEG